MNQDYDIGFRQATKQEKVAYVSGVFSSVASKYDVMNDAMSAGMHRLWKRSLINKIPAGKNYKYLDLAAGSGDISYAINSKLYKKYGVAPQSALGEQPQIIISDINPEMLEQAKAKRLDKNIHGSFDYKIIDSENIPFPDNSFDIVTISFGIRNVADKDKALSEIKRVLKTGGQFFCLEFSNVENPILAKFYDFYSFNIIPKMGSLIAGDAESYQYLVESIRKFPTADKFAKMLEFAGLEKVSYEKLSNGIVAIHRGFKA